MPPKLSPLTEQLVNRLFAPNDQAEAARRLVDECGNNLPFCKDNDEHQLERLRFAALRVSIGYLDALQEAIEQAKTDWRDLLMWAGFAESLTAHQEWAQQTLKGNSNPMVIILIGLSGSGKTTIGTRLERELGWKFFEGDNFYSADNFNRLIHGQPIPDDDVEAWVRKIRDLINRHVAKKQNAIFACTALKQSQRDALYTAEEVHFVYLRGTVTQLEERQKKRKMQISNLERLAYQSSVFEEPHNALVMDISDPPQVIVKSICKEMKV